MLTLLLISTSFAVATSAFSVGDLDTERPNILLFFVDDLGWQDISEPLLYRDGEAVETERNRLYSTPNVERLARQGIKFTQAYAEAVCTPTRVSLMTGRNAAALQVTNWVHPTGEETTHDGPLDPPDWRREGLEATGEALPQLLSDAGYHTVHAGKAHFGARQAWSGDPKNLGFDTNIAGSEIGHPGSYYGREDYGQDTDRPVPDLESYHGTDTFLTQALTNEAGAQMAEAVERDQPFFVSMAHYAVHAPFQVDPRFEDNYPSLEDQALGYATLIKGTDVSLGQLLERINDLGVGEETLVVFVSDNGGDNPLDPPSQPLRGKKGQLYEGGIRVPMVVAWAEPNSDHPLQQKLPIPAGEAHHGLVHVRDLYATLLAIAGIDVPPRPDSADLRSTLQDPSAVHRPQNLLMHFPHRRHQPDHPYSQYPGSVYRDGPWKLIYNYESGEAELYNLEDDLAEEHDLAGEYPDRVARMIHTLRQQLDLRGAVYPRDPETGEQVRPQALPLR